MDNRVSVKDDNQAPVKTTGGLNDGHKYRTAVRVAAIRRLIELLGKRGDLQRDVAQELMKVSESGIRNYFTELLRNEIVEVARRDEPRNGYLGKPWYRLIADSDKIERFLEVAHLNPRKHQKKVSNSKVAHVEAAEPGRHFHLVLQVQPKVDAGPVAVAVDPYALPVEFFHGASAVA